MNTLSFASRAFLLILLFLLAACASSPVAENTGRDAWSMRINESWVPQARRAVVAFDQFAKSQLGEPLKTPPAVFLSGKPDESKALLATHPAATVITLEGNMAPNTLMDRAQGGTLRASMRAMQQQLSAGQQAGIPHWLIQGGADLVALQLMESLGSPQAMQMAYASATSSLRRSEETMVEAGELFAASQPLKNRFGVSAMSLFMIAQLQETQGAAFWPTYAAYLRSAARPAFDPVAAFEASFKISRSDFMAQLTSRLLAVRTEQRQHAEPVPPASDYASIEDIERLPQVSQRKLFETYRKARSPKAIALSPRGPVALRADDADAMRKALAACRQMDELACQLYAVDDQVVYRPATAGTGGIEVIMSSTDEGMWTQKVKDEWLPLIERAVQQFNTQMLARVGTALSLKTRIYVTSSDGDYERVLHEDLKLLKSGAAARADLAGGVSNGKGHIALILRPQQALSFDVLRERALKTPLHELTHELQAELSQGKNSRSLVWIKEGTADLFGYAVVESMKLEGAFELTSKDWMQKNLGWANNGGLHVSPEELWTSDYSKWEGFMRQHKGPYQMAGLMAAHLETLMGERFFEAWVAYHKNLADLSKSETAIFEESFGLSREAFLTSFKASL